MNTMRTDENDSPHGAAMIALLVASLVAIAMIESTAASEWIAETGLIHLIAIIFVVLAAVTAARLRRLFLDHFKPLLLWLLWALALLGASHIVEYMIDVRKVLDEAIAPLFVAGFYTAGIALMIGAAATQEALVKKKSGLTAAIAVGLAAPVFVAVSGLFVLERYSEDALGPLFMAAFLMLTSVAAIAASEFANLARHFTVLRSFARNIIIAIIAVMVAGLAELSSYFLGDRHFVAEWVYENVSHYVFYAGLTVMYLAFDMPKHFGGVFADMRSMADKE